MAVHARGYRRYEGGLVPAPAFLVILREAFRTVARTRLFKVIGMLFLLWFLTWTLVLYAQVELSDRFRSQLGSGEAYGELTWRVFQGTMATYYGGVALLTAIFAIFVGAGLVSDDLRTRALPLYLVRPIGAGDYLAGKALVIPTALFFASLLPGILLWLLVASWQPEGEAGAFLSAHSEVFVIVLRHYLIAAATYTGVMLFLSSRSPRRGAVVGLAAVAVFGGQMLYGLGVQIRGDLGAILRCLGLPMNTVAPVLREFVSATAGPRRARNWLAPEGGPEIVAAILLLLGLWAVRRRARTVEVTG
jgi:ABC-type transport system involved in multi-copper enzyme maturation permease subunit